MEKPCKKCGCTEVYRVGIKRARICKACQSHRSHVWYEANKDKIRPRQKAYDEAHPEQRRERWRRSREKRRRDGTASWRYRKDSLWKMFRITPEMYDAILASQNGVCAICKGICGTGRRLAVDHNHACCPGSKSCGKCIRGLLCGNCNLMIGKAKDSPALLQAAIDYLRRV